MPWRNQGTTLVLGDSKVIQRFLCCSRFYCKLNVTNFQENCKTKLKILSVCYESINTETINKHLKNPNSDNLGTVLATETSSRVLI